MTINLRTPFATLPRVLRTRAPLACLAVALLGAGCLQGGDGGGVGGAGAIGGSTMGGGGKGGGQQCGPLCEIYCEFGNKVDQNGCLTCACNPAPVPCQPNDCSGVALVGAGVSADIAAPAIVAGCPDGSFPIQSCQRGQDGQCRLAYECPVACPALGCLPSCEYGIAVDGNGCQTCTCNPAPVCPEGSCGAAPGVAACLNGGGGLSCQPTAAGICVWHIEPCDVCPDALCAVFCPFGNKVDQNGCQTCDCNPAPCASSRDLKTCELDGRCVWLEPGCDGIRLPAAGCYDRTGVGCQGNAQCRDGRQCLSRTVDPCAGRPGLQCLTCASPTNVCL